MSNSTTVAKLVQYAALPYRSRGSSRTEVMLVTSRGTRRWIIPKGWPQKGRAPHRSAARSFRRGWHCWTGRQAFRRIVSISKAPWEWWPCCLRGPSTINARSGGSLPRRQPKPSGSPCWARSFAAWHVHLATDATSIHSAHWPIGHAIQRDQRFPRVVVARSPLAKIPALN